MMISRGAIAIVLLVAGAASADPTTTATTTTRTTSLGIRGWAKRNFSTRPKIRQFRSDVHDLIRKGDLGAAAQRLADLRSKPQGLRERIVVASTRHQILGAAIEQLRARSN